MGHNRKIRLFEFVRDAGPGRARLTRAAHCDLTYFNLSSPWFSYSRLLVCLFSFLLPLLPRLYLCLFFFLSLLRLAMTVALLCLLGFGAAASVILIAGFLRSLLDCCSDILREKAERDYSDLTIVFYRWHLEAVCCLSPLVGPASVSVTSSSAGRTDPRM
ncbi:hypothetical protein M9H77_08062 [Catharanthus roseus]|uniref:Uncharacterized protein n=1 Tax=Catharanthus roseus TaxID=4058 RepID=A0ACC0BWY4_CATRO|nr:hypothetical protein M9H77_08062 [Catharanthus roseus]